MVYRTPAQARRMIGSLDLPSDLELVLRRPNYRCETFLDLFIERCETVVFHDPQDGLPMAKAAVQLAEEIDRCNSGLKVRALAVLAGTHRQLGDFVAAEHVFQQALSIPLGRMWHAFLCCRLSLFRTDQERFPEAFALAQDAMDIYREAGEESLYGTALLYHGGAHFESNNFEAAFFDFSRALSHLDPKQHAIAHYCAVHNLAVVVGIAAISVDDLDTALKRLRQARKLIKTGLKSIPHLKLRWLEGVILAKIGAERFAERAFKKARQGFLELGAVAEAAYTALDLGVLLGKDARWSELEDLAKESLALTQTKSADPEALAALGLWIEATRNRTLDYKVVDQIRDRLLEQKVGG